MVLMEKTGLSKAKKLAGLDPTKLYSVDRYKPKNPSFAECLKSNDLNGLL